jgi:uncharacterized protein (DUF885 family)
VIRIVAMLSMGLGAFLVLPLLAFGQAKESTADAQNESARKFRGLLADDWQRWLREYPEFATHVGYPGQNDRWTDDSPRGIESRKKHLADSLATLKAMQSSALPAGEQLNFDLYLELLETAQEGLQFGDDPMPFRQVVPLNLWMPLNQVGGIQQAAPEVIEETPHQTVAEYETILKRLAALPTAVEQQIGLLQDGLKRGYTPPKITLRDVPKQIADLIPADPLASALLQPFTEFPVGFPEAERARLTEQAKTIFASCTTTWRRRICRLAGKALPPLRCRMAPRRTRSMCAGRPRPI